MRTIKFRAWDEYKKKMHYDVSMPCNDPDVKIGEWIPMQFTGFHDKNGKEIYEGDYFKISDKHGYSSNCIAEVFFESGCFQIEIHRKDLMEITYALYDFIRLTDLLPPSLYEDSLKIIGNKYENPGSLK